MSSFGGRNEGFNLKAAAGTSPGRTRAWKVSRDHGTFYCFSPPVMIATFVIELSLALYTFWRYKLTAITRLAVVLFIALGTFQLAEYMVCRGIGGDALAWSRIGYMAITLLPPIGIHLLQVISGDKRRWLIWPGYIAAVGFVAFFSLIGGAIDGHACLGNYVIFQVAPGFGGLFGLYYYGLLAATLLLGWRYAHRVRQKKARRAIEGVMLGYTVFIIPATTVNLVNPATISGIPSIMCGFAVLLALVLGFVVLPAAAQRRA